MASHHQSPAERFAAAARRGAFPLLTGFRETVPYELDPFQVEACEAVERGENVLVCAPTGAGKTVIGEFAADRALAEGRRCFYTTPIKALSNQKYRDLVDRYGSDTVGLLTGDTTVNPLAPLLVMTTEVLRNMLYAGTVDADRAGTVVLDEIHYLSDRFRGAVWEEVIIHLDPDIPIVGLSATVSNAEEFGEWIRSVRGRTAVIVDEVRPVPLWQHMLVGSRLYDLYAEGSDEVGLARKVNPDIVRAIHRIAVDDDDIRGPRRGRPRNAFRPAPRPVVIERLDRAGLLPAIVFIFSRAGCDAAVDQCLRSGLALTTEEERAAIDSIVDEHVPDLSDADLQVLDFAHWRAAWQNGIAAHHAGLLPAFKEIVEELFVRGLVKAVFATETLALGINMPARTVLLERLVKYDGQSHADLTPGEYTQLTGRAGRRGIDVEGHAAVQWVPGLDPQSVAGLAGRRTYPLQSSFRPTYNMVVNLVDRLDLEAAETVLQRSFAQFQLDRRWDAVDGQIRGNEARIAAIAGSAGCELGDAAEYADLCRNLAAAEKGAARARRAARSSAVAADLAALRRGDVILITRGRRRGRAVVLDTRPDRGGNIRPLVATEDRWAGRVTADDFSGLITPLGRLRLGKHTEHWKPAVRRDIASALKDLRTEVAAVRAASTRDDTAVREIDLLRRAVRSHPVHRCPDRQRHIAQERERLELAAQTRSLRDQSGAARQSLGRQLHAIAGLLGERGYLAGETATDRGRVLQRVWSETDLLTVECLPLWAGLAAAELAAVASALVFEPRGDQPTTARHLTGRLRDIGLEMELIHSDLAAAERRWGVPATRPPDFGFCRAVICWAKGGTLAETLAAAEESGLELSAGDFVRWCRQVIDILDQLRSAATTTMLPSVRQAVAALRRGVVALGAA